MLGCSVNSHDLRVTWAGSFLLKNCPDCRNWYRMVHPATAAPSGGSPDKKGVSEDAQLPFACLPFPLATKAICPDIVAAATGSLTDSRTNVSKLSPWNREQWLSQAFLATAGQGPWGIPPCGQNYWLLPSALPPVNSRYLFWDSSDCWAQPQRPRTRFPEAQRWRGYHYCKAPLGDFGIIYSSFWFCSPGTLMEKDCLRVVICRTFFVKMKLLRYSPYTYKNCTSFNYFQESTV